MKMRQFVLVCAAASVLLLSACADNKVDDFPLASRPLATEELPLERFGTMLLAARSFDVINQDLQAAQRTGIAGKVDPMPVDIVAAYAARRFRAVGGPYSVRFVIRKADMAVNAITVPETHWPNRWFKPTNVKLQMKVDLQVMLVASFIGRPDATINVASTQVQELDNGDSAESHRRAYLGLMARAMNEVDAEINRQIPQYMGEIIQR